MVGAAGGAIVCGGGASRSRLELVRQLVQVRRGRACQFSIERHQSFDRKPRQGDCNDAFATAALRSGVIASVNPVNRNQYTIKCDTFHIGRCSSPSTHAVILRCARVSDTRTVCMCKGTMMIPSRRMYQRCSSDLHAVQSPRWVRAPDTHGEFSHNNSSSGSYGTGFIFMREFFMWRCTCVCRHWTAARRRDCVCHSRSAGIRNLEGLCVHSASVFCK